MKHYYFVALLAFFTLPVGAAEQNPLKVHSSTGAVSYQLPKEIDQELLVRGSVIIDCGGGRGTGVAVDDRFILTAAHTLVAHVLDGRKISVFAVKKFNTDYIVPAQVWYMGSQDKPAFWPEYSKNDTFRELIVKKVHFHPKTCIQEVIEEPQGYPLIEITNKYKEIMGYGINSAEKFASYGILTEFLKEGKNDPTQVRTFGPDIVLLECEHPHGLPSFEISDPVQEERSLIHMVGLAGIRYSNKPPYEIVKGIACRSHNEFDFYFEPRIIGQRFKCLPGYPCGDKIWFNRPFLRVIENQYFFQDEIYPNAPKGFGLIAQGDSGSGAFIIKEGKPYLVGVASLGGIDPTFETIVQFLSGLNFNPSILKGYEGGLELLNLYQESIKAPNGDKKWYVSQALADVTHLKPWIKSFTSGN